MANRKTSAKVASRASSVLRNHSSTKNEKSVAASALSQRAPKRR